MTATELASFRALLQAQAAAPSGVDQGLFARMRARLTVVEGDGGGVRPVRPAPRLEIVPDACPALESRLADPPPARPPAFGRRECGPESSAPVLALEDVAAPRASALLLALCTPDEVDDPRERPASRAPATLSDTPTPGVITGWSRARPPSAHRRLLGRLEAVLLAEREGLDARRASDSPPG